MLLSYSIWLRTCKICVVFVGLNLKVTPVNYETYSLPLHSPKLLPTRSIDSWSPTLDLAGSWPVSQSDLYRPFDTVAWSYSPKGHFSWIRSASPYIRQDNALRSSNNYYHWPWQTVWIPPIPGTFRDQTYSNDELITQLLTGWWNASIAN